MNSKLTKELLKEINVIFNDNNKYLLPIEYNEDNFKQINDSYKHSLMIAFDLSEEYLSLIDQFCNQDLLWLPSSFVDNKNENITNVFQLHSLPNSNRESIISLFGYLFTKTDYVDYERYEYSPEHLSLLKKFYEFLKNKYSCPKQYINRIKKVLFISEKNYILENYEPFLQKNIFNIKETPVVNKSNVSVNIV